MHLDVEMERLEAAVAMDQLQVDNVRVLGAENSRHGSKRARNVAQDHRKPGRAAIRALAPSEVEPIGIDAARECVAANDVDLDFLILAPQPDRGTWSLANPRLAFLPIAPTSA